MTTLSSVNSNSQVQKGKQIGTVIGAGIGTGYLLKSGKDIFVNGIQEGLKNAKTPVKTAMPIAVAVSVSIGIMGLMTGVGRLAGAGIGKIVDKIKQHKEEKEISENMNNNLKQIKPITLDEIEKIGAMSEEEASAYLSARMKDTV